MYEIEFTPESLDDIKRFRKFEQQKIFSEIKTHLSYQPTVTGSGCAPMMLLNGN